MGWRLFFFGGGEAGVAVARSHARCFTCGLKLSYYILFVCFKIAIWIAMELVSYASPPPTKENKIALSFVVVGEIRSPSCERQNPEGEKGGCHNTVETSPLVS